MHGWAMSRYSGCWVAFKAIAETVESSASVESTRCASRSCSRRISTCRRAGSTSAGPTRRCSRKQRLHEYKLYAALAYARANRLDRIGDRHRPRPRLGIVTTGKCYLDVRQALDDLGIDEAMAAEIGLRVYKVGMTWPLEPRGRRATSPRVSKRSWSSRRSAQLIENQLKEQLYNWPDDVRPRVIGKFDEDGARSCCRPPAS